MRPVVYAAAVLTVTLGLTPAVQAAQLGKFELQSKPSEPFFATIAVTALSPQERQGLEAKLASNEAFKAARLEFNSALSQLKFVIRPGQTPDQANIEIRSDKPMPAGFLDMLVELKWAGGRIAREYTVQVPDTIAATPTPTPALPATQAKPTAPQNNNQANKAAEQAAQSKVTAANPSLQNHKVKRGESLSEIAAKVAGNGVTLNQAMAAIFEANKDAFINNSVHLVREGTTLRLPTAEALQSKTPREALAVLGQHDDRNVYSQYAKAIGALSPETTPKANAIPAAASNTASRSAGHIEVAKQAPVQAASSDRLTIAPGSGAGKADALAEELTAKGKALEEASERIVMLEKNVTDLQKLLEMQKDLSGSPSVMVAAGGVTPASVNPSETDPLAPKTAADAVTDLKATETTNVDVKEAGANTIEQNSVVLNADAQTAGQWLPYIVGGSLALLAMVTGGLVWRAKRKKRMSVAITQMQTSTFDVLTPEDEVQALAAKASNSTNEAPAHNKPKDDFNLDELLAEPAPAVKVEPTSSIPPVPQFETPTMVSETTEVVPELLQTTTFIEQPSQAVLSDAQAALPQVVEADSTLASSVQLDFPEPSVTSFPADANNAGPTGVFEDLDAIDKGLAAAQAELDAARTQAMPDASIATAEEDVLELDMPSDPGNVHGASNDKISDAVWQEVATKLDLAGAYVEIGDSDGARELIDEILKKGDAGQIKKAQALLESLS